MSLAQVIGLIPEISGYQRTVPTRTGLQLASVADARYRTTTRVRPTFTSEAGVEKPLTPEEPAFKRFEQAAAPGFRQPRSGGAPHSKAPIANFQMPLLLAWRNSFAALQ